MDGGRKHDLLPARDPRQARVVIVIAVTLALAVQPGAVASIMCDPLAGARDSRAFRADHALAVDIGIGIKEERVATRNSRLFQ
jgi:hypothetical protein